MRQRRRSALLLCVAAFGGTQDGVAQVTVPIQTPFQIETLESRFDPYADGVVRVVIGIGRVADGESPKAGVPVPDGDELAWMTLVGTLGFVHASRHAVERRCQFPCGTEDGEECHWVGIYQPTEPIDLGEPLAAIPGRLELTGFIPLPPSTGATDAMAHLSPDGALTPLLWDGYSGAYGPQRQSPMSIEVWDPETGRLTATVQAGEGPAQRLDGTDCSRAAHEWLLAIDCRDWALLASGGRPLVLSLADYNLPKVQPLARFDYAGSRHYVVRIGAKAQDIVGLLSSEPSGWRGRFRARDWALLC